MPRSHIVGSALSVEPCVKHALNAPRANRALALSWLTGCPILAMKVVADRRALGAVIDEQSSVRHSW